MRPVITLDELSAYREHVMADITRVRDLEAEKQSLVAYLLTKVKAQDWHAVQDAASDIRELEARLEERTIVSSTTVNVVEGASAEFKMGDVIVFGGKTPECT